MAAEDSLMTGTASSSDDEPVESLVKGRARRSTAGKNMGALLDAEADDELALLFAEEEDDEEFESGEEEGAAGEEGGDGGEDEADDMQLDSSSDDDDDDQGPNAQGDELEGERELERQAKAERLARKRKEQEGMMKFPALRKRVKIDPAATESATAPAPRPKKKSERISWLPTPEDGPTRSSSRRQTMQNKELTHARLKDSEEKRVRLIATMEEAARRKQKLKPKVMTQEERLAEAAKTERLNSKSLNRWEEMERKRIEEQQARLAALQNRRLEGAVATWWSGFAKWVNGKLAQVGTREVRQAPEAEKKRKIGKDGDDSPKRGKAKKAEKVWDGVGDKPISAGQDKSPEIQVGKMADEGHKRETKNDDQLQEVTFAPPQLPTNFLDGIHIYASMKDDATQPSAASGQPPPSMLGRPEEAPASQPSQHQESAASTLTAPEQAEHTLLPQAASTEGPSVTEPPGSSDLAPKRAESNSQPTRAEQQEPRTEAHIDESEGNPATMEKSSSLSQQPQDKQPEPPAPSVTVDQNITKGAQDQPTQTQTQSQTQTQTQTQSKSASPPTQPPLTEQRQEQEQPMRPPMPTPPPPTIEYSSRNLLILQNFETKSPQEREEYNIFFNSRKPQKLQKIPQELCPITSRPARYRDPETQLPYANAVAYREIRQTLANRYAWSGLLGCFVGPIGVGARGVPERFLAPNAPPPTPSPAPAPVPATSTAVLVGKDGSGSGAEGG
ncbi:hypothetical protein AJ78_02241 [Emergomyces pasteurianus Ep9510]|uniref:Vps72/YL1 C-terminal domain-containing protein n=1 Tax=Emergomyces pasteurianus Ep9510 TaxID=1447872 RepID=A0A1J9PP35_9EURO|nr:hypothetical protein AJ78_02241 [Emergomyces pasteurianus Ep9510]